MTADAAQETAPIDGNLPVGTNLCDAQFTITGNLGVGGFGITYRAMDNVLGRTVVIKECYPEDFCLRDGATVLPRTQAHSVHLQSIVGMFMREARSLAKLRHPNIVGVHRAFEENSTAYMALDLIDGPDLLDVLERQPGHLTPARVKDILMQILDAIEKVHDQDLLHRDISPDNIIIERTGTPVLIDFGAARGDASRRTRAISSVLVVKDGYSPQEFYVAGSVQTPSSDLYALGATFYHVISGDAPPNSQARMMELASDKPDPCVPLEGRIPGYHPAFLRAIDTAMNMHPGDRLQSAAQWRALIQDVSAEVSASSQEKTRVQHSLSETRETGETPELPASLSDFVETTNKEVRKSQMLAAQAEAEKEDATEAPPLKTQKMADWIDEFNADALAAGDVAADAFDDDDFVAQPAPRQVSYTTPERSSTETDWVRKAREKEERLRAEHLAALEAAKSSGLGKRRSQQPSMPKLAKDAPPPPKRGFGSLFRRSMSAGILVVSLTMIHNTPLHATNLAGSWIEAAMADDTKSMSRQTSGF